MFEQLFKQMPDAVFALGNNGTIQLASERVIQVFGFTTAELVGANINKLLAVKYPNWEEVYNKEKDNNWFDVVAKRKDGKEFFAEIVINKVSDNANNTLFLISVRDITSFKEIYNQLNISNQKFMAAFEHSAIGMALISVEGKWLKVNKSVCSMLGYDAEELMAKTFQDITHPDDLELDLKHVNEMLRGEIDTYQMEKRYFHKNGSIVWVLLAVSLSKDTQGNPLHFISQLENITERKEREEEQLQSIDIITKQNSRLLNFAHIVSHNLRSHTGNFQLLLNMLDEATDDKEHVLKLLKDNARTLGETIEHLNKVVQIQTNTNISKEPLVLNEYINRTIDVLKGEIDLYNVEIINNVSSTAVVYYNIAYLESLLLNILSNAIKYRHPERRPAIRLSITEQGNYTILSVRDNGVGMNLERHGEKLFGLYKTFHRNKDARGVGLFITRNQVEVMGGKIEVESEVNKGSTFKIFFANDAS